MQPIERVTPADDVPALLVREIREQVDVAPRVRVAAGEAWLIDCTIPEWKQATTFGHAPRRARKLLLHRREIDRLHEQVRLKGLTVVPLSIYFKQSRAKCEIALVRGRKKHDKREATKEREARKEMREAR